MLQPDPHPLWNYLPAQQRSVGSPDPEAHRAWAWMCRRRQRTIAIATYVLLWLIPLLGGQVLITSFALLPLLLIPPVGLGLSGVEGVPWLRSNCARHNVL